MKVEDDILHIIWFVESEFEGYLIMYDGELVLNPFGGVEDIMIIDESGWPYEHKG